MNTKIIHAVIAGIALSALGIGLRLAGQEGPQIILFFVTFFVVGIVATGIKMGFSSELCALPDTAVRKLRYHLA